MWKALRERGPSGPDGQRILDLIAAGIDANGAWESEIVCHIMCGEMYAFFNENNISKETFLKNVSLVKLETFLKNGVQDGTGSGGHGQFRGQFFAGRHTRVSSASDAYLISKY